MKSKDLAVRAGRMACVVEAVVDIGCSGRLVEKVEADNDCIAQNIASLDTGHVEQLLANCSLERLKCPKLTKQIGFPVGHNQIEIHRACSAGQSVGLHWSPTGSVHGYTIDQMASTGSAAAHCAYDVGGAEPV